MFMLLNQLGAVLVFVLCPALGFLAGPANHHLLATMNHRQYKSNSTDRHTAVLPLVILVVILAVLAHFIEPHDIDGFLDDRSALRRITWGVILDAQVGHYAVCDAGEQIT